MGLRRGEIEGWRDGLRDIGVTTNGYHQCVLDSDCLPPPLPYTTALLSLLSNPSRLLLSSPTISYLPISLPAPSSSFHHLLSPSSISSPPSLSFLLILLLPPSYLVFHVDTNLVQCSSHACTGSPTHISEQTAAIAVSAVPAHTEEWMRSVPLAVWPRSPRHYREAVTRHSQNDCCR